MQAGAAQSSFTHGTTAQKKPDSLPITVNILRGLLTQWSNPSGTEKEYAFAMLRVTETICFFGLFRSGELTVTSAGAFNQCIHRDVAADEANRPSMIKVHLKQSK